MAATSPSLIPYPDPGVSADVPYWNQQLADRVEALLAPMKFLGGEAVMKGASPPAGTLKIIYQGTAVAAVDATSAIAINFPAAFPNGLVTVLATAGDVGPGEAIVKLTPTTLGYVWIEVRNTNGTALATGSVVRVNWLAVGW